MSNPPPPLPTLELGRYRHYKNAAKIYDVLGVARHSETLEPLVIYRACYTSPEFGANAIWARPYAMFVEKVNFAGKMVSRFERI